MTRREKSTDRGGERRIFFQECRHRRLAKAGSPATARGCGELWRALLAAAVAVSSFRLDFDRKGRSEDKRAGMKRRGKLPLPTIKNMAQNQKVKSHIVWCPRPDSNRHAFKGQRILSPSCLPFHHSGKSSWRAKLTQFRQNPNTLIAEIPKVLLIFVDW